jgi:hypothetical protein
MFVASRKLKMSSEQEAKNSKNELRNLQARLEEELDWLKKKAKLGYELRVIWLPGYNAKLSGEVKGSTVYIYDDTEDKAIETLRHEFMDYVISKVIEPYKLVANKLIELMNEEAYKRKEKIIGALARLLSDKDEKQTINKPEKIGGYAQNEEVR